MVDGKKQNVSVRMNSSDLRKIKEIAKRLHARESDVFRFAIRSTLTKLAPLYETHIRGSELVPVFMEYGAELTAYFDLDTARLERIINDGIDDAKRKVDREDIELLAMAGTQANYLFIRLKELANTPIEPKGVPGLLKDYLFQKYVHRDVNAFDLETE